MTGTSRIGILGLGTMGGPMARRLAQTGFAVTGYDPNAGSAERAKADGVALAASPVRVAEQSDFVLSSLPDPATVRRAFLGDDGALAGSRPGMAFIDLSTTDGLLATPPAQVCSAQQVEGRFVREEAQSRGPEDGAIGAGR